MRSEMRAMEFGPAAHGSSGTPCYSRSFALEGSTVRMPCRFGWVICVSGHGRCVCSMWSE